MLSLEPLTDRQKSARLGVPSKGDSMSKYLTDKAFALLDQAQANDKLWKEAAIAAIEALVSESPYAQERSML